jgi:O-acetyl-ADP-ribose deacetylase
VRIGGRELLEQILAHAGGLLGHHRAQLVLDRDRGLRAEQPLELAREVAVLRREHVVDALAEELGHGARLLCERVLDLARDLLELRSHEVGVDLGLLARQHARADLDRVDEHRRRIGATLAALAHEIDRAAVAHGERIGDDDVAEHGDAGRAEWGGGFHTAHARYARHPTERRSADLEAGEALRRLVVDVQLRHLGVSWPVAAQLDEPLDGLILALEDDLHGAVEPVRRPPRHARRLRSPSHRVAEEDALHPPVGAHPLAHGHGGYRRPMAAIEVLDADITTLDVDAIANAANTRLLHGGGVAAAIARAGGPAIDEESRAAAPIGLGEAVETSGGEMPCRWVIHAATMELGGPTSADVIRRATAATLARADQLAARSLALVAFGTGVGGFPLEEAARIEVEEVRRHLDAGSPLQRVVFAVHGEPARAAFQAAVDAR